MPDVWSLSEWSNWLTPANLPRRYDTLFYTCFLEKEPAVLLDGKEMTHSKVINFNKSIYCENIFLKFKVIHNQLQIQTNFDSFITVSLKWITLSSLTEIKLTGI